MVGRNRQEKKQQQTQEFTVTNEERWLNDEIGNEAKSSLGDFPLLSNLTRELNYTQYAQCVRGAVLVYIHTYIYIYISTKSPMRISVTNCCRAKN